ncbi:MAG: hypothetical protein HQK98_09610, partial [Nitrospirae bacterium]|nr:hypothetical protein [Nitrospirota bacterium]
LTATPALTPAAQNMAAPAVQTAEPKIDNAAIVKNVWNQLNGNAQTGTGAGATGTNNAAGFGSIPVPASYDDNVQRIGAGQSLYGSNNNVAALPAAPVQNLGGQSTQGNFGQLMPFYQDKILPVAKAVINAPYELGKALAPTSTTEGLANKLQDIGRSGFSMTPAERQASLGTTPAPAPTAGTNISMPSAIGISADDITNRMAIRRAQSPFQASLNNNTLAGKEVTSPVQFGQGATGNAKSPYDSEEAAYNAAPVAKGAPKTYGSEPIYSGQTSSGNDATTESNTGKYAGNVPYNADNFKNMTPGIAGATASGTDAQGNPIDTSKFNPYDQMYNGFNRDSAAIIKANGGKDLTPDQRNQLLEKWYGDKAKQIYANASGQNIMGVNPAGTGGQQGDNGMGSNPFGGGADLSKLTAIYKGAANGAGGNPFAMLGGLAAGAAGLGHERNAQMMGMNYQRMLLDQKYKMGELGVKQSEAATKEANQWVPGRYGATAVNTRTGQSLGGEQVGEAKAAKDQTTRDKDLHDKASQEYQAIMRIPNPTPEQQAEQQDAAKNLKIARANVAPPPDVPHGARCVGIAPDGHTMWSLPGAPDKVFKSERG